MLCALQMYCETRKCVLYESVPSFVGGLGGGDASEEKDHENGRRGKGNPSEKYYTQNR